MDSLYSLYDALVTIRVPGDKARAVVEAMERDMSINIATKSDLQLLRQEMSLLATKAEVAEVRQEVALVRKDLEILGNRFDNRIDAFSTTMTLRLGSMLVIGLSLLFGALRLV